MKKILKNTIVTVSILLFIIILDTLQAIIFKVSPALSLKVFLKDNISYVDRGIFIDTYYCYSKEDIVTINIHSKNAKFTCPMEDVSELNEAKGVSMSIKESTLTKSGATIIIYDVSGKEHVYGDEYRIDKKIDDTWKELDVIVKGNYGWNSIGYHVDKDNKLELNVNWKWLYGELEKGEYRLVKNTSALREQKKYYFSVEFKID